MSKAKKLKGLDANIILRFLTNDIPAQAERCEKLFEKLQDGTVSVFLADITLADVIWVLGKYYKLPRDEIRPAMRRIIELKGLQCTNKSQALAALDYYVEKNIDWTDAFMATQLIAKGIQELSSLSRPIGQNACQTSIAPEFLWRSVELP